MFKMYAINSDHYVHKAECIFEAVKPRYTSNLFVQKTVFYSTENLSRE